VDHRVVLTLTVADFAQPLDHFSNSDESWFSRMGLRVDCNEMVESFFMEIYLSDTEKLRFCLKKSTTLSVPRTRRDIYNISTLNDEENEQQVLL